MTTRDLTASYLTALDGDVVNLALFFEGEFNSGTIRLWTGSQSIDWNGETWQGAGQFLGVSAIEETDAVEANGVSVSLSGVDTANIALVIDEARQGLRGRVWVALLDATGAIIADPFQPFVGRLDVPSISEDGTQATISISYESKLIDLRKPREWRYTDQSQKTLHPDDDFFEYVTSIQSKEITWGRA